MTEATSQPTCPDCGSGLCPCCIARKIVDARDAMAIGVPMLSDAVRLKQHAKALETLTRGRWQLCAEHQLQGSAGFAAYERSAGVALRSLARSWRALYVLLEPLLAQSGVDRIIDVAAAAFDDSVRGFLIDAHAAAEAARRAEEVDRG